MANIPFTSLPVEVLLGICTSPVLEIPDIASVGRANGLLRDLVIPALRPEIFRRRSSKYCRRALYHAAERRDRFAVGSLLGDGILDIIEDGGTLLNSAVGKLSDEGLTTLLACGLDPNTEDERGRTPLICATSGRCLGAIRVLLADGRVDVNRPWVFDFASLHLAVWNQDADVVRLLLSCPRIAVNQAIITGPMSLGNSRTERDGRVLATLMEDRREGENPPLRGGWPPLHGAMARSNLTVLAILLRDERVNVNKPALGGETPLRVGVRHNNVPAVCMLMAHPKIQAQMDGRILHFAVYYSGGPMIEFLLRSESVRINCRDSAGRTALHLAAYLGRADIVKLFLGRKDLDIRILDGGGRSARGRALPRYPGIARLLTVGGIVGDRRMDYLNLAL
ncbi:ankyrin [Tuber magnatum]|uniref:Ankyrin n=1 Tax=Tuber magnatum TaxID=42249 RepID=A0A317T1T0_9PEZI|nr:ankyrin [Tuber magnatum]